MATHSRIVVCDDDPHVRFGTVRMLRKAGYEVLEAENGAECLELVRREWPELVLVDWVMPDMEGPEVCRTLKGDPELTGIVVVMVSGSKTSPEDQADGLEIGADAYLTYPLHSRAFLATIAALLRMRLAEKRLRESQRLAALGALARGVGHEINNPLTGIINYAQLLHDNYVHGDATAAQFTEEIIAGGNRVARIVRGLMGFAGSDAQSCGDDTPAEVVNGVLLLCEAAIQTEGITIDVSIPEALPPLGGGAKAARQILFTLVRNARESLQEADKTAPDGSCLSITAEHIAPASIVRFSVSDNGPGIAREHRERIFEPFFTTKDRTQHTGLELTVARDLAHEQGGELALESGSDPWTRFVLDLPIVHGEI